MSAYVTDRLVPVRGARVLVDRTGDGLGIAVPPQRSWWQYLYAGWALFIIVAGLAAMIGGDDKPPIAFAAVWLTIGLWILGVAGWGLLARETLLVDSRALRHERGLGPVRRTRAYD